MTCVLGMKHVTWSLGKLQMTLPLRDIGLEVNLAAVSSLLSKLIKNSIFTALYHAAVSQILIRFFQKVCPVSLCSGFKCFLFRWKPVKLLSAL